MLDGAVRAMGFGRKARNWWVFFATCMLFLSLGAFGARAEAQALSAIAKSLSFMCPVEQRELSCASVKYIKSEALSRHVSFVGLNTELENRTIERYIDHLDPSKRFFLKSDTRQVRKWMRGVFAQVDRKNCSVLQKVHALYVKRLQEVVNFVRRELAPETFRLEPRTRVLLDTKDRQWPKTVSVQRLETRRNLQLLVAQLVASGDELKKVKGRILRRYERMLQKAQKDASGQVLLESYLQAFTKALDPHSLYMTQSDLESLQINTQLSLSGIGAELSFQDGFTVVNRLLPGGAAMESGQMEAEDKIVQVGQGVSGPMELVRDVDLNDVVKKIRGPAGTVVRLGILRTTDKGPEQFVIALTRKKISLEEQRAKVHYRTRKLGGQEVSVAVIDLPSFYQGSRDVAASKDVRKLLQAAKLRGAKAVVLDVSFNGGGLLDEAVKVAGLFLRKPNVVKQSQRQKTRRRSKEVRYKYIDYLDKDADVVWSGPLVVLTSRGSASASEIVAGTLRDYGRALVVGSARTFGKGSVQEVNAVGCPKGKLGALKVTSGLFFTAGGQSTQNVGVMGDVVLPSRYDAMSKWGEQSLDYVLGSARIASFVDKAEHRKPTWQKLSRAVVSKLKAASRKRLKQDKKFKKILTQVKKDKNKKRAKFIYLSEILKELKEDDQKAKSKKKKTKQQRASLTSAQKYKREQADRDKEYMEQARIQEAINIARDLYRLAKTP